MICLRCQGDAVTLLRRVRVGDSWEASSWRCDDCWQEWEVVEAAPERVGGCEVEDCEGCVHFTQECGREKP